MKQHSIFRTSLAVFILWMISTVTLQSQKTFAPEVGSTGNLPVLRHANSTVVRPRSLFRTISAMPTRRRVEAMKAAIRKGSLARKVLYVGGHELMANLVSSTNITDDAVGLYKFTPTDNFLASPYLLNPQLVANGGSVIVADTFYCSTVVVDQFFGEYYVYSSKYSLSTGEGTDPEYAGGMGLVSSDMTLDPSTGKVYGLFYTDDGNSMELATLDFATMTKSVVDTLQQSYVAIAASKAGKLFAIRLNGSLYTLDKTTAEATAVGKTGVTPGMYFQSATYDDADNTIYWTAIDNRGRSMLYRVDVSTGKATLIHSFSNGEEYTALTVLHGQQAYGSPAGVVDMKLNNDAPALDATLSFKLPSATVDGNAISGNLDWVVLDNGDVLLQGNAAAGSDVNKNLTLQQGLNSLTVYAQNSAGQGTPTTVNLWGGYDIPDAVSNVKLTTDDQQNAKLSWTAPKHGMHNAYLSDNLKYTIIRYPGADTVAVDYPDTSFTESLKGRNLALYYYQVVADNAGQLSAAVNSNKLVIGEDIMPPYTCNFNFQDNFNLWSAIDANGDGDTWYFEQSDNSVLCFGDDECDDWLISSPVHLNAGYIYTVGIYVNSLVDDHPMEFDMGVGEDLNYQNYQTISQNDTVYNTTYVWKKHRFTVNKTGNYRIGIRVHGPYLVGLKSFTIDAGAAPSSPSEVNDLSVERGAKGALTAKVSFTAPTVANNGNKLDALSKIEVYRNDSVLVGTVSNVKTGGKYTVEDANAVHGVNSYKVVPFSAEAAGLPAEKSLYIGLDLPAAPHNVVLHDNGDNVSLTWSQPDSVGVNGSYVDANALTYNIWEPTDAAGHIWYYKQGLTDRSYTFDDIDMQGAQTLHYYYVQGVNDMGEGTLQVSNGVITGKNYELPYSESWPLAKRQTYWWMEAGGSGYTGYSFDDTDSYDGDGGCLSIKALVDGDNASMNTGKIDISKAKNPKLFFYYKAMKNSNIDLQVYADKASQGTELLWTKNTQGIGTGWQLASVDLKGVQDAPYVLLKFTATCHDTNSQLYIDNVNVVDALSDNLTLSASLPDSLTAGTTVEVPYSVKNMGENDASGYKVELLVDGKTVASEEPNALTPMSTAKGSLSYRVPVNAAQQAAMEARLDYAADADASDNTTGSKAVKIVASGFPTVDDLQGSTSVNTTTLTWSAPKDLPAVLSTDDFESYNAFSIDNIGKWTVVDGDKAAVEHFNGYVWDHCEDPQAWIVFNPVATWMFPSDYPTLRPHSGDQFMASFPSLGYLDNVGETGQIDSTKHNDDWLITPRMPASGTVSFYARSYSSFKPESFEVLYSTTSADTASFVHLATVSGVPCSDWTRYSYTLPADARYFAIRCITLGGYCLEVDDVTYPASLSSIEGYNIYRDGELVGSVDASTTSYTDVCTQDGLHTFNVTVVYGVGESAFSNGVSDTTDIRQISAESRKQDVFSTDGVRMPEGRKLQHGVYIINGTKRVVK